jgi:membrane protein
MSQPAKKYRVFPVRHIYKRAHGVVLPGLNGATLFEVSKFFVKELKTLKLQERAAATTYNFLMALPPTFLFLFSLVPYLPLKNVEQTILNTIKLLSPNPYIYNNIRNVVIDFMNKQHRDALSYGLILILFFASNGVMGFMRSFDKSLSLYVVRTGFRRRMTAIKLTLVLIGVNLLGLAILIFQSKDLNPFIKKTFHSVVAVKAVSFIILALLVFLAICIIYTYGPSLKHRFKFFSAGAFFATLATGLVTSVFFFLVNHFINYNKIYGSIGTLIAFMVWLWLNTIIILLGYELNVSLLLGKLSKATDTTENAEA